MPDPTVQAIIDHARCFATSDRSHDPDCVHMGKLLRAYDEARGATCVACNGVGSVDTSEEDPGDGPTCPICLGTGLKDN